MTGATQPTVSVILIVTGDTCTGTCSAESLTGVLQALTRQNSAPFEIIVPYHRGIHGMSEVIAQFPGVRYLDLWALQQLAARAGSREHHDMMRASAARAAGGELLAFLEDHVRPAPDWVAQILAAHAQPYAGIGGVIENGIDRPLNWAAYYLDLGKYALPLRSGVSPFMSLVNGTYKRAALGRIAPVWQTRFSETEVNAALQAGGEQLALDARMQVSHYRTSFDFRTALQEFYIWGKSYASIRSVPFSRARRGLYTLLSPALALVLTVRAARRVLGGKRNRRAFLQALPYFVVLAGAWSLGEMAGYLGVTSQPVQPAPSAPGAPEPVRPL